MRLQGGQVDSKVTPTVKATSAWTEYEIKKESFQMVKKRIYLIIVLVVVFWCISAAMGADYKYVGAEKSYLEKIAEEALGKVEPIITNKRTGEEISIVKCNFDKTASFWIGPKNRTLLDKFKNIFNGLLGKNYFFAIGDEEAAFDLSHDKDFSFIIAGLNSDKPIMKGNLGESELHILLKNKNTIYLIEVTPAGNANYITLFPKRRLVIFSKQYQMINGEIAAIVSVGHIE